MSEKVKIEISKEAYEKAKKLAEEGGFDSVSSLIEFLIEEASSTMMGEGSMTKEDEEKVKERLKDLGYM